MSRLSSTLSRDIRQLNTAKEYFQVEWPEQFMFRTFEVAKLPSVNWKGRPLKTLTCSCCGNIRNVPESVCWALISLDRFICEYCTRFGKVNLR
jgi:hypothetical protein